jgi:hypothetical protein
MMGTRTTTSRAPYAERSAHPDALEFVRFCYGRRRVGWPELYDEMCAVAGRGLFRGLSADDLAGLGLGFTLFDMPALAGLASRVVAEQAAMRRPVTVTITDAIALPAPIPAVAPPSSATPDERTLDVPIGLALATVGA